MPYISESSDSEFISLIWKELYYDSYSVTSFKKATSEIQGKFYADSNSEKSDPKLPSERPSITFGR
jgi:hypothetical protein